MEKLHSILMGQKSFGRNLLAGEVVFLKVSENLNPTEINVLNLFTSKVILTGKTVLGRSTLIEILLLSYIELVKDEV